jgi:hypothetical protein
MESSLPACEELDELFVEQQPDVIAAACLDND